MSDNTDQHRRNLVGLCFIILVYIFGGGQPNSDGSFLGGSFELANKEVVEWAAIMLLFYWLYRFYLSHRNPFPHLDYCIKKRLAEDNEFKEAIRGYITSYFEAKINEYVNQCVQKNVATFEVNDKYHTLLSAVDLNKNIHIASSSDIEKNYRAIGTFKRGINADLVNARNQKIGILTFTIYPTVEIYYEIKAFIEAMLNQEDFWDTLFPYFFFAITVASIFYRCEINAWV